MRLASLADLKTLLEKTDSDQDSLLGMILDSVSISFEGYTNRKFEKISRTEYFDSGGKIFKVHGLPIDTTVATVLIIDSYPYAVNDDYYISADKGYFEFYGDTIRTDPLEVSITYTGGYGWTAGSGSLDVPHDLSFACLLQAAFVFRNRRNLGQISMSMPDGSVSINSQGEFLPQVISVLDRYRL